MKAIIKNPVSNGKNYSDSRELVESINIVGMAGGELKNIITCHCYMGRSGSASTVYASVWVHSGVIHTSGHGSAGGVGHHKSSAAIAEAISSAGIELYGSPYSHPVNGESQSDWKKREKTQRADIGGCGDGSVDAALLAVARAIFPRGKFLIVRN